MAKRKDVRCDVSVGLRITAEEKTRLDQLSARAGLTVSQTLKALIAAADVQPVVKWVPTVGGSAQ